MQMLLDKEVDIFIANTDGWTPLNSAADSRYLEVVKLCLTIDQVWLLLISKNATIFVMKYQVVLLVRLLNSSTKVWI